MSDVRRERVGDWLIVVGALLLFGSLFLTWSHQFSPAFLAVWGASDQLRDVPHDPTAWQVYSAANVILALLAAGLVVIALAGTRAVRAGAMIACSIAVAFTLRALTAPPTNGANILNPALSVPNYFPNSPGSGIGETVALLGLGLALAGLLLSFTAD